MFFFIQAAISRRKVEVAADQAALQEVLRQGEASGVHPFNQPGIPVSVKVGGAQQHEHCRLITSRQGRTVEGPPVVEWGGILSTKWCGDGYRGKVEDRRAGALMQGSLQTIECTS